MTAHALFVLAQAKSSPLDFMSTAPMFVIVIAVFYFVVFRPQQKQMKEQAAMLGALKKGDEVVTTGGLIGKIFSVADKELVLELAPGLKVRALKTAVQVKVPEAKVDGVKADDAQIKKEEK